MTTIKTVEQYIQDYQQHENDVLQAILSRQEYALQCTNWGDPKEISLRIEAIKTIIEERKTSSLARQNKIAVGGRHKCIS